MRRVTIYPSEFGRKRLLEEQTEGPRSLLSSGSAATKSADSEDASENDSDDDDEMKNEDGKPTRVTVEVCE